MRNQKPSVPDDVLEGLSKLHKEGKATIREVMLDFVPQTVTSETWRPMGLNLVFADNDERVVLFPWQVIAPGNKNRLLKVQAGDRVCCDQYKDIRLNPNFVHKSDRFVRRVTLALWQKNAKIILQPEIDLFLPGSLLRGFSYKALESRIFVALKRDNLWFEPGEPPKYYTRDFLTDPPEVTKAQVARRKAEKNEQFKSFAERALEAAQLVEFCKDSIEGDLEELKIKPPVRLSLDTSVAELVEAAAAVGYLQGMSEFAPNRKLIEASVRPGSKSAETRGKSSADWQVVALQVAAKVIDQDPGVRTTEIVKHVLKALAEVRMNREKDTIYKTIARWRKKEGPLHRLSEKRP